jgi:hypothetical protein
LLPLDLLGIFTGEPAMRTYNDDFIVQEARDYLYDYVAPDSVDYIRFDGPEEESHWESTAKKARKKRFDVKNLGKATGYPFCMVYLFTKTKTEVLCGSLDRVDDFAKKFKLCHGMVHFYQDRKVDCRRWNLFNNKISDGVWINLEYVRSGAKEIPYSLENFLDPNPKQSKYYMVLNDFENKKHDVVASWRKMPSTYIKEFDEF